ncbi:MAG: hypothetical protein WB615_00025 [Candidatus Tumulicola sp.]
MRKRLMAVLLGLAAILPLAGCQQPVDLQKVQEYAKAVAVAAPSFDVVADDYARTCVQIREYRDNSRGWLQNAPEAEMTPPPSPAPAAASQQFVGANPVCSYAALVAQQWQKRNKIVVDYVHSLAAIAGVDTQPGGVKDLMDQLTNVGLVSAAPATIFTALGNAIIQSYLESEQQAALHKALAQGNGPFQDSTAALRKLAASYQTLLAADLVLADGFFQVDVRKKLAQRELAQTALRSRKISPAALAAAELSQHITLVDIYNERRQWLSARLDIQNRMSKASTYDATMGDLASTNKDLTDASEKGASFGDMVGIINQHVVPLTNDAAALSNPGK